MCFSKLLLTICGTVVKNNLWPKEPVIGCFQCEKGLWHFLRIREAHFLGHVRLFAHGDYFIRKDNITRVAPNLALGRPTAPQIEDVPSPFDNS